MTKTTTTNEDRTMTAAASEMKATTTTCPNCTTEHDERTCPICGWDEIMEHQIKMKKAMR
jgi:recombinational DNA repair protein RecR